MLIIFDLDGTLINTIDDLGQACNYALQACGFPTHAIEDYPRLVGNGVNNLIRRALPEGHQDEATVLRLREHFVSYYDAHNCNLTRPYNGICKLLQTLKKAEHKLAVASNKYQAATEKIVAHYFSGVFDVVLGERVGVARKPDPQIVWDIVSSLRMESDNVELGSMVPNGAAASDILYIGDSLVDAQTAKAAGATLVLCTWGFCTEEQLREAKPDYLIQYPFEIEDIICSIEK